MSKRVLLVDDNESVRGLLKLYMSASGYKVIEAQDGLDGLTKAKSELFDVFVIDYKMPVMNGITLIKGLRDMPQYANKVMVLLTTDNSPEFIHQSGSLEDVLVLSKPVEQSQLLEAMKHSFECSATLAV